MASDPASGPFPDSGGPFPLVLHDSGGFVLPQHLADKIRALAPAHGGGIHIEIRGGTIVGSDLLRRLMPR